MKNKINTFKLVLLIVIFLTVAPVFFGSATASIIETQITTNSNNQDSAVIYNNKIVWQDNRNGNYDIYICTILKLPRKRR